MLPSRGVTSLRSLHGLRNSLSGPAQPACTTWRTSSSRQFSQLKRITPSRQSWQPSVGRPVLRSTHESLPIKLGTVAGASRSLSLWPFGSKQQPDGASSTASTSVSPPSSSPSPTSAPTSSPTSSTSSWESTPSSSTSPSTELSYSDPVASQQPTSSDLSYTSPSTDPTAPLSPEMLNDFGAPSIIDIPEQIGYLKHLGLDFGYGPTSLCQWFLEHTYIYTGLPWWATIAFVGAGIRLALLWPSVVGYKHAARLALLQKDPEYAQANETMRKTMWDPDADNMEKMKARARVVALTKRHNASAMKSFLPQLAIVPLSYGMFRILRNMATLPVPSLETGGFAWITDLTVYDPTYALPLVTAAVSFLSMQQLQKANLNPTPMSESTGKMLGYVMVPLMFVCTMWFPAALQWFFFVFSLTTAAQSTALITPSFRRLVQLPPLPTIPAAIPVAGPQYQAPSQAPARGLRGILDKDVANLRKGLADFTGGSAKDSARKARDYEQRRAREEKEKLVNKKIEHDRKRQQRDM